MRKAAATRVLVLFRFLFLSGLPPLVGTCGAKVTWETNCFSVGNRLKSGPYSLSTTSTVSTPIASIYVISTPLIRYNACRFGSCPRFLIIFVLLAFSRGGAVCPRCSSRSMSPSFRRISFSSYDGAQNRHPGHPIDVGNGTLHAHVHLVQALLHPPQPVPSLRHQVGLIPHQRPQHADRFLRSERTAKQSATVQPLNPLAICRVRLFVPPRHPRQLPCIHQQQLQTLRFQHFVR